MARRARQSLAVEPSDRPGWWVIQHPALPHARIEARIGHTPTDGVFSLTGLQVETTARAISARDLRELRMAELLEQLRRTPGLSDLIANTASATRPPRPGNVGYSEQHWQDFRERLALARDEEPRRYVQYLVKSYEGQPDAPAESTLRRWIKRVDSEEQS